MHQVHHLSAIYAGNGNMWNRICLLDYLLHRKWIISSFTMHLLANNTQHTTWIRMENEFVINFTKMNCIVSNVLLHYRSSISIEALTLMSDVLTPIIRLYLRNFTIRSNNIVTCFAWYCIALWNSSLKHEPQADYGAARSETEHQWIMWNFAIASAEEH